MKRLSLVRFLLVFIPILATALLLQARTRIKEPASGAEPVADFSLRIGPWIGKTYPIDQHVLDVLGQGDFLSRSYVNSEKPSPYIDFFIGYFASQRAGNTAHSPRHCLPGSGWDFAEILPRQIVLPQGGALNINRAIIQKGPERQLMYYWYQSHGRSISSEYWAKFYLVSDAIHLNRTDGGIVRLITPITANESLGSADARLTGFLLQIVPQLPRFIPN